MLAAAGKATVGDLRSASRLAGTTVNLLIPAEGADQGVRDKLGVIKKRFGDERWKDASPTGPES